MTETFRRLVGINVFHHAIKIRKRAVHDAHLLIPLEDDFGLRAVGRDVRAVDDGFHFVIAERRRRRAGTDEAGDPGRGTHHVPRMVIEIHLHEHVTRIGHPLGNDFLAAPHLDHVFDRNHQAADFVLQAERSHTALEALLDLLLEARVRMDDVPLHRHNPALPQRPTPNRFMT